MGRGAKRRFAGGIPKRRLGTTGITIFFGCGTIGGGGVPMGSHARLSAEVADIFISLGRNENSAMTVGGGVLVFGLCSLLARGWIVPVGDAIPDRREAALRGTTGGGAWGRWGVALGGGAKQSLAGRIPKQSLGTTG